MTEKPDIKIFVSHRIDLDSETIDNPLYIPVRCGAVYDERENVTMLGDDTGDNISEKRGSFCELTVQYWAWKNVKADYYGLCHYRRYFSFSPEKQEEDIFGQVNCNYLDSKVIKDLSLMDDEHVYEKVCSFDFLVGTPADLKKVNIKNVREQYKQTPNLNVKDLDSAIDILKEMYPDFSEAADKYMEGNLLYPCNMLIAKAEIFNDYCSWLFSILEKVEKKLDISTYSLEGHRTLAHIAERLLGVYYTHLVEKGLEEKLSILQRTIIWNTSSHQFPHPAFSHNNVPVVFCFSDFFVPYFAVTFQSLLKNISEQNNYDVLILHTHVSLKNQKLLIKMTRDYTNVSLRFFDIGYLASSLHFISNNHVSVETFYRLISNRIFKNYEKVVYLDSDIIIQKDVYELYNTDLKKSLVGAVVDADHAGEYNGAIPGVKKYTDKILKLKEPYKYFQAGVLIFNIKQMNLEFEEDELTDFAQEREFMYVDQDVLNVKCENQVTYLDPRWNVMTDCDGIRIILLI